ncbi:hypothetical protein [Streptomyces bluensis]|uniref:Uncharacterized protein n=1 Tax=Streptomyces bluensis TaxID=33897 RepID=A0ABW6UE38_9ACTN
MARHRAPLIAQHKDGSQCLPSHKHSTSGKPLHPDCPGRYLFESVCTCGTWKLSGGVKSYVNDERKRHLATHRTDDELSQRPAALRGLPRFDAS